MKAAKVRRFPFDDGTHVDVPLEYLRARANELRGAVRAIKLEEELLRAQQQARTELAAEKNRKKADFLHRELDDAIRGCLARGEDTGKYVKGWSLEFDTPLVTVYRRIKNATQPD